MELRRGSNVSRMRRLLLRSQGMMRFQVTGRPCDRTTVWILGTPTGRSDTLQLSAVHTKLYKTPSPLRQRGTRKLRRNNRIRLFGMSISSRAPQLSTAVLRFGRCGAMEKRSAWQPARSSLDRECGPPRASKTGNAPRLSESGCRCFSLASILRGRTRTGSAAATLVVRLPNRPTMFL